jgi:hypothetical protein
MLRGVCNERLKFAIEYGNKRGTTENTYVVKVRPLLCSLPAGNTSEAVADVRSRTGWQGQHIDRRAGRSLCRRLRWVLPEYHGPCTLLSWPEPHIHRQCGCCFSEPGGALLRAVRALESVVALKDMRTVVLTHLTPKRMASVKALLARRARAASGAGPLDVHLSNPALQLLRSSLGATSLLGRTLLCVAHARSSPSRSATSGSSTPYPRQMRKY